MALKKLKESLNGNHNVGMEKEEIDKDTQLQKNVKLEESMEKMIIGNKVKAVVEDNHMYDDEKKSITEEDGATITKEQNSAAAAIEPVLLPPTSK